MAELAHGIKLGYGTDPSFTYVGQVKSIGIPGQSREILDSTTMDSTNKWREKAPGLLDAGEITLTVEYDGAASGVASILQTKLAADPEKWTVTFPDTSTFECSAFVSAIGIPSVEVGGEITQDVTMTLTGEPTFTPQT